jgi:hypothetical protein
VVGKGRDERFAGRINLNSVMEPKKSAKHQKKETVEFIEQIRRERSNANPGSILA